LIDLVPTILEATGAPGRHEAANAGSIPAPPGKSLVAAFAHDGAVKHDDLWWEHEGNRAIRVGDWKAVAAKNAPWELFDLASDRTETRDLASEKPTKARELAERWQRHMDEFTAIARADLSPGKATGSDKPVKE